MIQGTGPDARTLAFAYDPDGYLAGIADALGRRAGFAYDPAGRVTTQTFPDAREVQFGYDLLRWTGFVTPSRTFVALGNLVAPDGSMAPKTFRTGRMRRPAWRCPPAADRPDRQGRPPAEAAQKGQADAGI